MRSRIPPVAAAVTLALAAALVLAAVAATGALFPGEVRLTRALQDAPAGARIDAVGDFLAVPVVEGAVAAVSAIIAIVRRNRALAVAAIFAAAAIALNPELKLLIGRARPTAAEIRVTEFPGGNGFPSGHTLAATLLYGYAAAAAWRLLPRRAAAAAGALAAACIAAIGFERVYSGAHWPSDVAGGLSVGVVLLAAALALPRLIVAVRRRR